MNLIYNQTYMASLKKISINVFQGKTIMVTGATGMIGSCLVDVLMQNNQNDQVFCTVIALGRSTSSAKSRFKPYWNNPGFIFIQQDVSKPLTELPPHIDYIIHAASNADPINYAQNPVDILLTNVVGTGYLLSYGVAHGVVRFLFVSSGEMYGQPNERGDAFVEDYCGPIDYSSPRSCYPSGKRAAEVLCQSYVKQYQADVVIVRPCHIFGPTMSRKDSRAVSEFLWNVVDGKDIVLKSAGLIERSHCYVLDAVQGILTALIQGQCGEAYNIADKKYQMTIRDFARQAALVGGCQVVFESPSDLESSGYSKIKRSVLLASKLIDLGWEPCCSEGNAIAETIGILKELKES